MGSLILSRLVQAAVLLIGVSVIGFTLMHLAPGGPLAFYTNSPGVSTADLVQMKHALGLDRPVAMQYLFWATDMLRGNWGYSFFGGRPVRELVFERLPATFELMGLSMALAMLAGTGIGVVAAVRKDSLFDHLVTLWAMLALSLPTFWYGLLAIFVFGERLGWLPVGGRSTLGAGEDIAGHVAHLVLPVGVLATVIAAQWSRYSRAAILDELGQDYMRTALAKGLSPLRILIRHGLCSGMLPLIALAGLQLPMLVGGALVTETVFAWPGMGLLFVNALSYRDYPVLMALLMLSALVAVMGNLLADIASALADPRIRLGRSA
ncbi:ABC transporter permease [Gluconacetobacter azotocaptans]|uniref:ABC transporter permease n=1 Tax=Gluconacetobacter azotocaptans TaxID=142834 RepID=UPI00195DE395|nr:ABC transporter permease [Gluconacetobacter azotocaptans]MBM9401077.1 ABC transporter permease [Gluconacetobacter azotocaptans]